MASIRLHRPCKIAAATRALVKKGNISVCHT
jgi:hypothetical protein